MNEANVRMMWKGGDDTAANGLRIKLTREGFAGYFPVVNYTYTTPSVGTFISGIREYSNVPIVKIGDVWVIHLECNNGWHRMASMTRTGKLLEARYMSCGIPLTKANWDAVPMSQRSVPTCNCPSWGGSRFKDIQFSDE